MISRYDIWIRDHKQCHLCHQSVSLKQASRDHVIPRSNGGPNAADNLRLAHKKCNQQRGTMRVATYVAKRVGVRAEQLSDWQDEMKARRERREAILERIAS